MIAKLALTMAVVVLAATCDVRGAEVPGKDANKSWDVTIKDGWFHVNGEPFFVKGQGYELGGGRGGIPRERTFDPKLMLRDITLLKEAGFNTVRGWNPYTADELRVLKAHGLMVIQGSYVDFGRYMTDPAYARRAREELVEVIRAAKPFDNILFHSISNEPRIEQIVTSGMAAYTQACRELVMAAKAEDPTCLLGYSHCMRNEALDQSMWDVVFFNDYMYTGDQLKRSLKYRGHVEWLIRKHAAGKPFVLGEFGLSVSPSGVGNMGYGGNTLEEQRDGAIHMYQSMIDAGGQGGCLFMWRDGWWKFGDKMTHDDHAEEWYGVLGIDDSDADPRGTPRPVYYAFNEYNQLILTEPRHMAAYEGGEVPVHAYVMDDAKGLRCRIDGGEWIALEQTSPSWRRTRFTGLRPGHHKVEVRAQFELPGAKMFRRTIDVVVADDQTSLPRLTLTTDKTAYDYGDTAAIKVEAISEAGQPMADLPVVLTYADHCSGEGDTVEGKTGADGVFRDDFPLFIKPSYITVGAGSDAKPYGVPFRMTDAAIIQVRNAPPLELDTLASEAVIETFDYKSDVALAAARGRVLAADETVFEATRDTDLRWHGISALSLRLSPARRNSWGFSELFFPAPKDLSGVLAGSVQIHGDETGAQLKLMLIDEDGERWFDEPIRIDFKGWRDVRLDLRHLQRDPFDGIKSGDGRPNPIKVAGLAFAVNVRDSSPVTLVIDHLTKLVLPGEASGKSTLRHPTRRSAEGQLLLDAENARIDMGAEYEAGMERRSIGNWHSPEATAAWRIKVDTPDEIEVFIEQACPQEQAGSTFVIRIGDEEVVGTIQATGGWGEFKRISLGTIRIEEAGVLRVRIKPQQFSKYAFGNVRSLTLVGDRFKASLQAPAAFKPQTLSRHLRVDLLWDGEQHQHVVIQRATSPDGPFETIHRGGCRIPVFSDFLGAPDQTHYYRVRCDRPGNSPWSHVVRGDSRRSTTDQLLTEVQEASFRYFWDYAHPVSALARESSAWSPEMCAIGASGMGLFNLGVGVERGFVPRRQAANRALKVLRFLATKAHRYHGAYGHWINGETGTHIPFGDQVDGADLVETAFLAAGFLFLREYFAGDSETEHQVRALADRLFKEIEWDHFIAANPKRKVLDWHRNSNQGERKLEIAGFNESVIAYLLAIGSSTHGVSADYYWQGWRHGWYSHPHEAFGIPIELCRGIGFPLFFTHYSYLGLDPKALQLNGRSYFEHFRDACRIQVKYAASRADEFEGYGPLWGLTASAGLNGYTVHEPGAETDQGTISPTAALSSMPYLPEASIACLKVMYDEYGAQIWDALGFRDAFNPTRDWVAEGLLGIDAGPIAPMIENHRTGLCWTVFMKAPEVQSALHKINAAEPRNKLRAP